MYNQNTNQPTPAQSFGRVQETYKYRLDNFKSGDQFVIVEDMPKSKPIRVETKRLTGEKNGRKYDFDAKTYLIRISSRGYEADIELKPRDIPMFAILCPKGLDNFKGATFVYDGSNWSFLGIETVQSNTSVPISNISQAMRTDPRQPDLSPPAPQADQKDVAVNKLVEKISEYNMLGVGITTQMLMVTADKLLPGDAVGLIGYGKAKGLISEVDGKWKVN